MPCDRYLEAHLFLDELYEVAATIIKEGDGHRSQFRRFRFEQHTELFQPFVLLLNILYTECRQWYPASNRALW